jgi:hypothetical protein
MAPLHLQKLIAMLLTAILNTVDPAAGNALLTAEQRHIALCVQTIAQQYLSWTVHRRVHATRLT